MIQAIHPEQVTKPQEVTMFERLNDTAYPVLVDTDNEIVAVVMVTGDKGYAIARYVAAVMQEVMG